MAVTRRTLCSIGRDPNTIRGVRHTKYVIVLLLLLAVVVTLAWYPGSDPAPEYAASTDAPMADVEVVQPPVEQSQMTDNLPEKAVLDISVHTIEELRVLFDRAENYAMTPRLSGEHASIVLVLHGPEVEFFSINNYDKYKDVVDQAARLDAFDIVDVKICQTMLEIQGVRREDIPTFIEQVPQGPEEVERLVREGYVYF